MSGIFSRLKAYMKGEQNLDKLIKRGLVVGKDFKRMEGVIIDPSHCWHITIGDNVVMAPRVHILAHDASTKVFLNHTRVANTRIGNDVFIGAGTIVLPGVTIGDRVVIGAGSVVTKDIPNDSVAAGNPAHVLGSLSAFLDKEKHRMSPENVFGGEYTLRNKSFGEPEKRTLLEACEKYANIYVE